jgi:hypothetical protein
MVEVKDNFETTTPSMLSLFAATRNNRGFHSLLLRKRSGNRRMPCVDIIISRKDIKEENGSFLSTVVIIAFDRPRVVFWILDWSFSWGNNAILIVFEKKIKGVPSMTLLLTEINSFYLILEPPRVRVLVGSFKKKLGQFLFCGEKCDNVIIDRGKNVIM